MHNTRYDFSSIHVDVPSPLSDDIIKWGEEHISDDDLFINPLERSSGREDEIHVTILYGIHSASSDQILPLIGMTGPVTVRLGRVDVFTNPLKFDVVMIEVHSDDLKRLNDALQQEVPHTNRYGAYHPHVTIAYVKKGKGWKYRGESKWLGKEFTCDYAVFSSKNGTKERILL